MMNERRTLHPAYIGFGVLSILKGFLPIILISLIRGANGKGLEWYWFAGGGGALLLFAFISYLQWRRFGFWLENDRIIIRSGLVFREEKTIYYSRIHSVNIEQPLIQRMLGVVQLKIETPGGNKKADGILHTLKMEEANRIKELLRRAPSQGRQEGIVTADAEQMSISNAVVYGEVQAESDALAGAAISEGNGTRVGNTGSNAYAAFDRADTPDAAVALDAGKLFQAAATSLNFGLAAAFIGGLYSFADDFLDLLLPDHFFEDIVEDSISHTPNILLIVGAAVLIIGLAWVLSILLYILKYSGFTLRRDGKQVSLSYGLLEKKNVLFDPANVQAVIVNESWLRQPFGYSEVKLQVVSSDKNEQLMLHPFIKFSEIQELLDGFVPGMRVHSASRMSLSPRKALIYYVRIPMLIALVVCASLIAIFGAAGAWSLVLLPLTLWWRISSHRAAGLLLEEGQLTMRHRVFGRSTYYIRRPRIVVMKVRRTSGQRRKGVGSLSVNVLGSPFGYKVAGMDHNDIQPIWNWFSRTLPRKPEQKQ
ncbi:PH domain-containing protein [Paenibacillus nanensis]|nr:PH domain-containing protein [Paenibacillus nanensis]